MTLGLSDIRSAFLTFFKQNGHEVVSSSPLVPHNDPTLMFTNAGMVQFKDVFTKKETRPYTTATSSQKCVRAGGKHNDLDNVGYTARHHTFFEMLGNFSFGDYFKEEAIVYAWDFLTKEIALPKEKLLVTVYHEDEEARALWKKISGLSDDNIISIATQDNFWAMGDVGPCGPCSEIFYDHGDSVAGGPPGSKDEDGDRFVEIWNLVFMQYESLASGERVDLPSPSIDTGMGLERMAAVLQGVHSNYETDLFQTLIAASKHIAGEGTHDVSHRVIADHLRSISFLIADGVMPSNEGRGYVLRRIMRRAMRHARQLGYKKPILSELVPVLVQEMGGAFNELVRGQALITEIIRLEEERFGETLDRGLKHLEESIGAMSGTSIPGDVAFKLYDTYGFPLDLTVDIARNRELTVDTDGFDQEMTKQKERAKAAWKGSGEVATSDIWYDIKEEHGATEFLGYETLESQSILLAAIVDDQQVTSITQGQDVQLVLNQTPFYGESGGQEGDSGVITTDDGTIIDIKDTKKLLDNLHVHIGKVTKGSVDMGQAVSTNVHDKRRQSLRANHTATHLLHAVLREVLGEHVTQKGSLVAEDRLRFDIAHPKAISAEELDKVEEEVNRRILSNAEVHTKLMTQDEAVASGALALFGEKYGEEVRVVDMGDLSVELCGGTHVARTGEIGLFKIISESAIAAGVRRIEAVTAEAAYQYTKAQQKQLQNMALSLKVPLDDVDNRVGQLVDEQKKLKKDFDKLKKESALGTGNDIEKETIGDITFIGKVFDGLAPKDLRSIVTDLLNQVGSGVVACAANFEGKGSLIIAISKDLESTHSAVDLIQKSAGHLGAQGGGGKPGFAQTGGPNGNGAQDAINAVKASLS